MKLPAGAMRSQLHRFAPIYIASLTGERTLLVIAHDQMWMSCADVVNSVRRSKVEPVLRTDAHSG
jgi:hypothetical protein